VGNSDSCLPVFGQDKIAGVTKQDLESLIDDLGQNDNWTVVPAELNLKLV
jgi:hypothetical protein